MQWSNWQGAIWRGAALAFLFWAGLAWTQSPTKRSTPGGADRIMVVHENGKATRCRVMETWQLPDGRMANLLQALETSELITIVDEIGNAPGHDANRPNLNEMPKRIFGWGQGSKTPPDGSPVPPHLRLDSGVVVKNNTLPPTDGIVLPTPGVTIINQAVDNKALGTKYGERYEGTPALPRPDTTAKSTGGLFPRLFPKRDSSTNNSQVIDFGSPAGPSGQTGVPLVSGKTPTMGQSIDFADNVKPGAANQTRGAPITLPEGSDVAVPSFPKIVNHQSGPDTTKKPPLLTRLNPFAPKEVIEVVPQVTEANAFGPAIVQGMEQKPPQQRPLLGGLWKTPVATPSSLTAGGQPVLPTTPSLGAPSFNGQLVQTQPGTPSATGPLVVNGNDQPILPTTPGAQPVPSARPLLGNLWKTPNATASTNPATPGTPNTPLPSARTPDRLPDALPLQIVNGEPSVPTKPVEPGSTAPTARPIFGGMFKTPTTTAANTPGTTAPNGSAAPTKRPLFSGLFKTPAAAASTNSGPAVAPTPFPGALPNPSDVAKQTPATGTPNQLPNTLPSPNEIVQQTPATGTPNTLPRPNAIAQQTPATVTPNQLPNTLPAPVGIAPPTPAVADAGALPNTSRPIVGGIWKSPNGTSGNPNTANTAVPTVPQVPANAMKSPVGKPDATDPAKPWRPGDRIIALFQPKPSTPAATAPKIDTTKEERGPFGDTSKPKDMTNMQKSADFLAQQNKMLEKQLQANAEKVYKVPFSTAMSSQNPPAPQGTAAKETGSLAIPKAKPTDPIFPVAPIASDNRIEKPEMFGKNEKPLVVPPGQSLLEPIRIGEVAKLPAPPVPTPTPLVNNALLTPERFVPNYPSNLKPASGTGVAPKPTIPTETPKAPLVAAAPVGTSEPNAGPSWPLGAQSVLAAKSGLVGPVTYIMVPTVTVPAPHNPPSPPMPQMPDAPQLNQYVNGFSPPPVPKGAMQPNVGNPMAMANPYANPMLIQQMMYQQAMMQQYQYAMMQHQQQQYAMMQQQGYRPNPYMPQNSGHAGMLPSPGPTSNGSRYYAGPMPPNGLGQAMAPMMYPPAGPQPPMIHQTGYQQPAMPTQQSVMTQQVEQIIRVLRESPYPAQRESAAQSLTSFEWRAHPQIIPALLQSASQDPAPNVRAGCVNCLGRMKAAVEPVFGTLQALRSDIDPRVRHEVEAAFTNLGQTPIMPGYR